MKKNNFLKRQKKNNIFVFLEPGWTGIDCSIDIDECKTIQPCKAAKTCINLQGSYKCECLDSFTGQNCEMVGIIKSFFFITADIYQVSILLLLNLLSLTYTNIQNFIRNMILINTNPIEF
jgi:hypothetical protein